MTQQNLFENYKQLIQAIWFCEENHLLTPALVMIYTAIDSVSWIAAGSSKESGKAFKRWVSEWMLKDPRIKCSAEELYAARCGVVHTLTPNSSLTQKGVRRIAYSWGTGDNVELEALIQITGYQESLASVHLSDLIQAFSNGMADYLEHVYADPALIKAFEEKSGNHFAHIPRDKVKELLALSASKPPT